MSVAQSESKSKHRRAFQKSTEAEAGIAPPTISLDRERDLLADVLPNETLRRLAAQHQALDQRDRQVPVVLFFWAMVLSQAPGQAVSLGTVVLMLTSAAIFAGLDQAKAVCSRKTISDNLKERPWQFFQAVYTYLLTTYGVLLASQAGLAYVQSLQHVLIIDATVMRVAQALIQTFPANRTGRQAAWAALKVHVAFWLCRGLPEVVNITPQKTHDTRVFDLRPVGEKVLYLFDLGYWFFKRFDDIIDRGQHFVSRLKEGSNPLILEVYEGCQTWVGQRLKDITLTGTQVDLLVNMTGPFPASRKMTHNVRLVGQFVDEHWHLYITSILDRQPYSVELICQVYALRWQVEMLFKNLKSVLQIKNFISTSENGVRVQIYAALILYLLTRVILLKASHVSHVPQEKFSLPKCLTAVAEGLRQSRDLFIKGRRPDWHEIENRLVKLVLAVARRDNPKRKHRLTHVNSVLATAQAP